MKAAESGMAEKEGEWHVGWECFLTQHAIIDAKSKDGGKYFVSSFSFLIITRKTFTIWYLHEIQTPNTSNTSRLGIFIHQHSKRYVNIAAHRQ